MAQANSNSSKVSFGRPLCTRESGGKETFSGLEEELKLPEKVSVERNEFEAFNPSIIKVETGALNAVIVCGLRPLCDSPAALHAISLLSVIANDRCSYRSETILKYFFEKRVANGEIVIEPIYSGLNFRLSPNPKTLLHCYSENGWVRGIRFALEKLGCDLNKPKRKGSHYCTNLAAYYGHSRALRYVLSKGLSANKTNKYNENCAQSVISGFMDSEKWWHQFIQTITEKDNLIESFSEQKTATIGESNDGYIVNIGTGLIVGNAFQKSQRVSLYETIDESNKFEFIKCGADRYRIAIQSHPKLNGPKMVYLTVTDAIGSNEGSKGDINHCKVTLQPLNKEMIGQQWKVQLLDCNIDYDFGVSNYKRLLDGDFVNHSLYSGFKSPQYKDLCDKVSGYKINHRYFRISPLRFGNEFELCVTDEPIPAMVNDLRVWHRKGCLILRPIATPDIGYERFLKGRFQLVRKVYSVGEKSYTNVNFVRIYGRYSRVLSVLYNDDSSSDTDKDTPTQP